jgi:hypothetical protein
MLRCLAACMHASGRWRADKFKNGRTFAVRLRRFIHCSFCTCVENQYCKSVSWHGTTIIPSVMDCFYSIIQFVIVVEF